MTSPPTKSPARVGLHTFSAPPLRRWQLAVLLLPYLGLLCPLFYFRDSPELWGIPFFFWYQFVWVPLTAALTAFVYLSARK